MHILLQSRPRITRVASVLALLTVYYTSITRRNWVKELRRWMTVKKTAVFRAWPNTPAPQTRPCGRHKREIIRKKILVFLPSTPTNIGRRKIFCSEYLWLELYKRAPEWIVIIVSSGGWGRCRRLPVKLSDRSGRRVSGWSRHVP